MRVLLNQRSVRANYQCGKCDPLSECARRQRHGQHVLGSGPCVGKRERQRATICASPVARRGEWQCRAPRAVAFHCEILTRDPDRHGGMRAMAGDAQAGRLAAMDQTCPRSCDRVSRSRNRGKAEKKAENP